MASGITQEIYRKGLFTDTDGDNDAQKWFLTAFLTSAGVIILPFFGQNKNILHPLKGIFILAHTTYCAKI